MKCTAALLATTAFGLTLPAIAFAGSPYDAMIAAHAAANGVPVELVHRVIIRESRYNPRAVNSGNYGMMQIRLGTARGLGYTGTAQGLLDPNTNLTYAVKYLAGAYRVANGNHNRAVALYAGGYYYAAKRQGLAGSPRGITADSPVFASFTTPGAPATVGVATPAPVMWPVPTMMTEAGAPPPAMLPGSSAANRAFASAQAAEMRRAQAQQARAQRMQARQMQQAQAQASAAWFKDQSRPRNVHQSTSNPFASWFKPDRSEKSARRSRS